MCKKWWLAPLLAMLPGLPALATDAIVGTVVDAHGTPVAGARVGSSLTLAQTREKTAVQIGYNQPAVVSDANGTFRIPAATAATIGYTNVLVAAGPDGSLGFAAKVSPGPNRITVSAPARLIVAVIKNFGQHHETFGFDLLAHGSTVAYGAVSESKSAFVVPQGSFELALSDSESVTVTKQLVLTSLTTAPVRLELQPTLWARNLGKLAPNITPTDVQNWPTAENFAAPRGKWVLVDFWATWCQPCVAEMPKLIAFYEQHAAQRARYEIVAVHSPDGKSFSAIRSSYDQLTKNAWSGKSMPFPLVFDATGATHKRWGIDTYPTTLLIDPAGRLVGEATIEDLAKKLGL